MASPLWQPCSIRRSRSSHKGAKEDMVTARMPEVQLAAVNSISIHLTVEEVEEWDIGVAEEVVMVVVVEDTVEGLTEVVVVVVVVMAVEVDLILTNKEVHLITEDDDDDDHDAKAKKYQNLVEAFCICMGKEYITHTLICFFWEMGNLN